MGCGRDTSVAGRLAHEEPCVALERFPDGTESLVCVRSTLQIHGRRYDICSGRANLIVRNGEVELARVAAAAAVAGSRCVICAEISHLSGDGEHRLGVIRGLDCSLDPQ